MRHVAKLKPPYALEENPMEKWPIGVFTSIDAGLGVKIEVAHELGVPTIQLHLSLIHI